jgi:hypothetical protein
VKSAPITIRTEYDSYADKPLKDNLKKVVAGSMDINTALRDAEDAASKTIQAAVGK